YHPPDGSRDFARGDAPRSRDRHDGPPSRHGRRHGRHARTDRKGFRKRRRRTRRRRDETLEDHIPHDRGKAGRELPQDDHRDGEGYPGDPGEARRSLEQYAHAEIPSAGKAAANRAGNARYLRPDREPPRDRLDEDRARRPLSAVSPSRRL